MSDQQSEFNLIDEPWILAQKLNGEVVELSILDVVAQAHELRRLVGELPTQVFAITRVLLAILHRAIDGPVDANEWGELWQHDSLPVGEVRGYLERHRDRFDLFHPSTPFFQVAGLHTAKSEVAGLEKLIADVPAGQPFFTTRLGPGLETLSPAEATRWLVHAQAFDISGIKSGAVGDSRVKGGKGYPIGTGWAGYLGGILVEGQDLRESIILNMVAESYEGLETEPRDVPVWEREPQTAAEEVSGGRPPYGSLDLFTWQSRRIRLVGDRGAVRGVVVCNGDKLTPQNQQIHEPMSGWRRSEPQEKKLGSSDVVVGSIRGV